MVIEIEQDLDSAAQIVRARDALIETIEEQRKLGLLSIRASGEGIQPFWTMQIIKLVHEMDKLISLTPTANGTILQPLLET